MTEPLAQGIVFGVLGLTLALLIWGRWRYDVVAMLALLTVTVVGIVPGDRAFAGFGHPAVVTVAAVLALSRALVHSGLVDHIARVLLRLGDRPALQAVALTGLITVLSGFMNNIGALALLLPVALQLARQANQPPSLYLMPLAFGSLLGGMTTLIGTPPNIIIAAFRAETGADPFRMFDFTPVGAGAALAGVLFMALAGRRLLPRRKGQTPGAELFDVEDYLTEVRVTASSPLVGKRLHQLGTVTESDVNVVGLVRKDRRQAAPSGYIVIRDGDILIIKADSQGLQALVEAAELELVGSEPLGPEVMGSDEVGILEAVIAPGSIMVGRTARNLNLRWRHGVNLLAVARQGSRLRGRLESIRLQAGDVLLLQAPHESLQESLATLGCLPLAERGIRIGQPRRVALALAIFAGALAAAAGGLLPVAVAMSAAVLLMVLTGLLSLRDTYEAIDWPVLILLGAMVPLGEALEATGGAQRIAGGLLALAGQMPPAAILALVLVVTMLLSDVVNNAAAAVVMAPIALRIAQGLGAAADPFLIAVAVGASSAFLTPIGHQSNILVMGPGGYRFSDYWRLGLPLEVIIVAVTVPLILWFWPL